MIQIPVKPLLYFAYTVLFLLLSGLCVYLIITVRNLNQSLKSLGKLIHSNEENIDKTLKDLPVVSKNAIEITELLKNELKTVGQAINNINETAEMTAATAQTIKTGVVDKAKNVLELVDVARRIFVKDKSKEREEQHQDE